MDLDDPATTYLRKRIIREKPFLNKIYQEWYRKILAWLPDGNDPILEIGSGAGFLDDFLPQAITSDVLFCPWLSVVLDARRLPLANDSLRAVVMSNVFHHLPDARRFLKEGLRCVRREGRLLLIEPWVSAWSRLIYRRLHHEPFDPDASEWKLDPGGPLSSANGALPWIVFERDRTLFDEHFSEWNILHVHPWMPFRYLLSGGVALRSLMPAGTFTFWRGVERMLEPWMGTWAMFALIVLERQA
jgi:SAM-dependent methyltransferase